ncbi:MAG: 4Fe-4S binding protein, partial [Spirochaetales bacterium]|nr:4Fe-4S binding protein [Spirochaetales bacterium]
MRDSTDVYRSLQRRIDALPIPFPETRSGVELRLLQHLFNPEEAALACQLSALGEPLSKIHKRVVRKGFRCTEKELKKILNGLLVKGAITGGVVKTRKGVERTYSLLPLAIGMFEMQVDHLTKDYTRDFEEYLESDFSDAILGGNRTNQVRTVPVGRAVESLSSVGGYDDIRTYVLQSSGPFGVMNCVCRQGKDLLDKPCDHSDIRETCLTIGPPAVSMSRRGSARLVDREEFLGLLKRAEEKGFVLQARNTREPTFICCCCGDCCEILTTAKKLPRPVEAFHTNFFAQVDSELCNACGRCVRRCQMDAVGLTGPAEGKNGKATAQVDLDRCIGCGLCVTTCPTGSL